MIAIIFKEVRENLKWAVLWTLGVLAAMAFALVPQSKNWYGDAVQTLCSRDFQLVTALGSAIGGTLLGLLQSITEVRRDQCAFLFHRPLTRTRIFAGKAAGGLTLYLAAMSLPLLLAILWAKTPGQFAAPFDLRMALPGVADILTGIVFYFAGILAGMRPARWYGSRALGVVAAVPCAMAVWAVPEFWQALIIIGVVAAILGFAAWGSFISLGAYNPQPRRAKFALGLSVLVGIMIVGVVAGTITSAVTTSRDGEWVNYAVDVDGTVLRITYNSYSTISITDLNGDPVENYATPEQRDDYYRSVLLFTSIRHDPGNAKPGYRSSLRFHYNLYVRGDTIWYYVNAARRVLGYSPTTNRNIATLGPGGFTSRPTAASQLFPGSILYTPYSDGRLLIFPSVTYRVDYDARTLEPVFTAAKDQVIAGACLVRKRGDVALTDGVTTAVSTNDSIELFADERTRVFSIPLHCDPDKYGLIRFATTAERDRHFVWYTPASTLSLAELMTLPDVIVELSADGTEVRRYELPSQSNAAANIPWQVSLVAVVEPPFLIAAAGAYAVLTSGLDLSSGNVSADVLLQQLSIPASFAMLCGVVILLTSVCCALVAGFIGRRYGFARDAYRWWALVCLFTGLGGLLTMWALIDWPARVVCASCGKKTAVDRERCQCCDAEFPAPALDGTEVFDG